MDDHLVGPEVAQDLDLIRDRVLETIVDLAAASEITAAAETAVAANTEALPAVAAAALETTGILAVFLRQFRVSQ